MKPEPRYLSRRDFLRLSSLVGASALLAAVPASAPPPSEISSPEQDSPYELMDTEQFIEMFHEYCIKLGIQIGDSYVDLALHTPEQRDIIFRSMLKATELISNAYIQSGLQQSPFEKEIPTLALLSAQFDGALTNMSYNAETQLEAKAVFLGTELSLEELASASSNEVSAVLLDGVPFILADRVGEFVFGEAISNAVTKQTLHYANTGDVRSRFSVPEGGDHKINTSWGVSHPIGEWDPRGARVGLTDKQAGIIMASYADPGSIITQSPVSAWILEEAGANGYKRAISFGEALGIDPNDNLVLSQALEFYFARGGIDDFEGRAQNIWYQSIQALREEGSQPPVQGRESDLLDNYPYVSIIHHANPETAQQLHFYGLMGKKEGQRLAIYSELAPVESVLRNPIQYCKNATCQTLEPTVRREDTYMPHYIFDIGNTDIYLENGDTIENVVFNLSSLGSPDRQQTTPRSFLYVR